MTKTARLVLDVAELGAGSSRTEERNSSIQKLLEEFVRNAENSYAHEPEPQHGVKRDLQELYDELWLAMHKQYPAGKISSALRHVCHLVGYRMKR